MVDPVQPAWVPGDRGQPPKVVGHGIRTTPRVGQAGLEAPPTAESSASAASACGIPPRRTLEAAPTCSGLVLRPGRPVLVIVLKGINEHAHGAPRSKLATSYHLCYNYLVRTQPIWAGLPLKDRSEVRQGSRSCRSGAQYLHHARSGEKPPCLSFQIVTRVCEMCSGLRS